MIYLNWPPPILHKTEKTREISIRTDPFQNNTKGIYDRVYLPLETLVYTSPVPPPVEASIQSTSSRLCPADDTIYKRQDVR
jgi:hypothetical protein